MRKILTIARREFFAMVATKAFLLSLTLMPVLMLGGVVVAARMAKKSGGPSDRRMAVADGTRGELFGDLQRAATARNAAFEAAHAERKADDAGPALVRYALERWEKDVLDDADRLSLSQQVREGKLKAFVEIPANILDTNDATRAMGAGAPTVLFNAPNAVFSEEREWFESAVNDAVQARRFEALNLDPKIVARATAWTPVVGRGLVKELSGGRVGGGVKGENLTGVFLPFAFMMLMFMVIMMSAQPLLESVMEEKNGRVAELLLGSVNAFQLMLGKLVGNVAGSLTVVCIYAAGGLALAAYKGWLDLVPWNLMPWFLLYQVVAVLLFSSLFMAVGSAVTQLKEAQSMLLPVWLLMSLPMFTWLQVVREPNGALATGMSFFPPSAPLVMVLRLAGEEVIPLWQILASLVLLTATTLAITFIAARIFRIGMLWQGKTPKMTELLRWAWSG